MSDYRDRLEELIAENKAHDQLREAKKTEHFFGFIGFTIFDIVHIAIGLYFFIVGILYAPENHLEIAESIMEVVLSITLIVFIHGLADTGVREASFAKSYSFAWLMASASLLTPCLFKIVEMDVVGTPGYIINLILIAVNVLLYLVFFISIFARKNHVLWRALVFIGIILGALSSIVAIVLTINNVIITPISGFDSGLVFTLQIAKHLAPLVLSIMASIGFFKVYKTIRKA